MFTRDQWIAIALGLLTPLTGTIAVGWRFGADVQRHTAQIERIEKSMAEDKEELKEMIRTSNAQLREDLRDVRRMISEIRR